MLGTSNVYIRITGDDGMGKLFLSQVLLIDFFALAFGGLAYAYLFKRFFPSKQHDTVEYTSGRDYIDENVYDEGYINDLASFDDRIDEIRMQFEQVPAVEIITDEFEKDRQNF